VSLVGSSITRQQKLYFFTVNDFCVRCNSYLMLCHVVCVCLCVAGKFTRTSRELCQYTRSQIPTYHRRSSVLCMYRILRVIRALNVYRIKITRGCCSRIHTNCSPWLFVCLLRMLCAFSDTSYI
jgi:hypothetical protein